MTRPQRSAESIRALDDTVARIRQVWPVRPSAAIILGTGLGEIAEQMEAEVTVEYHELPAFPRSTAVGHRGRFVCGRLVGRPVIVMDGRFHLYEGYSVEQITLPVRVMQQLGAPRLIVSNASGGLNPQFASGDVMVVTGHIDLMGARSARVRAERHGDATVPSPRCGGNLYDPRLIEVSLTVGRQREFPCHPGVYIGVLGPNYETRAEYRYLRKIGGDAVGMSTIPEVLVGAHSGMRVLALSTITNVARPDAPTLVDADEVVDIAHTAAPRIRALLEAVLLDPN